MSLYELLTSPFDDHDMMYLTPIDEEAAVDEEITEEFDWDRFYDESDEQYDRYQEEYDDYR